MTAEPPVHPEHRLAFMPVTLFAMVMGLTGLSIAWDRLGYIIPIGHVVSRIIAAPTSALLLGLLGAYTAKAIRYWPQVREEIGHPVRINFFPTISISLLLLSVYWQSIAFVALSLFVVGASLQLIATLFIMNSWLHHTHYQSSHINPSWFIPVVGNIIVPISGTHFGYVELSWFFFSIGILYWLVLFTVVLNRLILHEALPPKLTPMMFILLAPPSIGFVSYTLLVGVIDTFARILFYSALFIALLLTFSLSRFGRLPFSLSSWAYSFPLAALIIATTRFAQMTLHQPALSLAISLLMVLTIVIAWLVVQTARAAIQGKICVPE